MSYRKLSGARRWFNRYRWYGADDHLLVVRRLVWQAEYRRIFLSDVQSLVVWPRHRERVRATIWMGLALLFGGPELIRGLDNPNRLLVTATGVHPLGYADLIWGAAVVCLGAVLTAIELGRGPFGCAEIRTRTSTFRFPLANRWEKTLQVGERVRELVEQRQGAWAVTGTTELPRPDETLTRKQWSRQRWNGMLWAAAGLMLASGTLSYWVSHSSARFLGSSSLVTLRVAIALAASGLALAAALRMWGYRTRPGVRSLAVLLAIVYPLRYLVFGMAFVKLISGAIRSPGALQGPAAVAAWQAQLVARSSVWIGVMEWSAGLVSVLGFLLLRGHYAAPEPGATATASDETPAAAEAPGA